MPKLKLSEEVLDDISGGAIFYKNKPAEYLSTDADGVHFKWQGEDLTLEWNDRALQAIKDDPGFLKEVHDEMTSASMSRGLHQLEALLD